ncbi:hypothetical protein TJA_20410 [Thermus sp. LT1-2-5]|uniref:type II toxin-antitoxin system PemK/MazF family toxin n=1 Tax=Thermus sp. LT1-2-5 TaxID=3026935 RepID=UPI0030E9D823
MSPGALALLRFPHTDLSLGKPRPVLLLTPTPGPYPDWLVAMVSSQLDQAVPGLDETLLETDPDFPETSLKRASVVRLSRLAVVDKSLLLGKLGAISPERLRRIQARLCQWISGLP